MRYTLAELLEDKKLRKSMAEAADNKELDFEDGNSVFDLDFRSQSLRLNHRRTFDLLCELGGEKLLKKLVKAETTCLSTDRSAANQGVCAVRGTENYFLLTAAGPTKAFTSILNGIAAWAKTDKAFDPELVCVSTSEEEEEAFDSPYWMDDTEVRWLHGEEVFGTNFGAAVENPVLSEKDGKPVFIHPDTGKEIWMQDLYRLGGMITCEPLRADEYAPVLGYRYQTEENGKWGFISARLACVTLPRFDGIQAAESLVTAWTEQEEETMDMMVSLRVVQEGTDIEDHWLTFGSPEFKGVHTLYQPLYGAQLEERSLDNGLTAYLYRPNTEMSIGLLWLGFVGAARVWGVRYREGFVSAGISEEKIPASSLTMEKSLQLVQERYTGVQAAVCVVEPEWNGIGTYIIRKDGYWALADVDVSEEPEIKHLLTPLAYTRMERPQNWPHQWVLVERFGKKGIYNWMREKFVVSCEYEDISLEDYRFILTRHGSKRIMSLDGVWLEEAKAVCPKCGTELVRGALYCHMCGVSLTEPEKKEEPKQAVQPAPLKETPKAEVKPEAMPEPKVEAKPEPVKEVPKPEQKPVKPHKPSITVPTKSNFNDLYINMGRSSGVFNNQLKVTTRWNDKEYTDRNPDHFLYGDQTIYHYKNKIRGVVVGDLCHLNAYVLGERGIFYAKDDEIWYWDEDDQLRKLGRQKNVIRLYDEGNGKLTVEYVERLSGCSAEYIDGDYYEEWYNLYDVYTNKITLNY